MYEYSIRGILFLMISCQSSLTLAAWEQFQGNAQHTGYVPSSFDASTFQAIWSVSAPPFPSGNNDRSVAIVNGDVYATMRNGGGSFGPFLVTRFDGATGISKWQRSFRVNSFAGMSAPAVLGNSVFVHHFGHSGNTGAPPEDFPALLMLDGTTGVEVARTQHEGQWRSGGRPTIDGDAVFVNGGYGSGVDAYDLDAKRKWFRELPTQQNGWIPATDAENTYAYTGGSDAALFVMDRISGVMTSTILHPRSDGTYPDRWQNVLLGGQGDAFALTYNDHPAGANSKTLVKFDIALEQIAWEIDGDFSGYPAIGNGLLYVPDGDSLRVVDQVTGATAWSWNANDVRGNVVVTDNYVFVNANGGVHAIDLITRESVWNSGSRTGELALDGRMLVISNETGVYAFAAIPEPSSILMLLAGAFGGTIIRKLRKPSRAGTPVPGETAA